MYKVLFQMESLSVLAKRAFIQYMPISENDLPFMRLQYQELVSCYSGFSISHDCAKYMSWQICQLMHLFHSKLTCILQRFLDYNPEDTRHCVLHLELEIGLLFRELNSAFNEFHVSQIHSVLVDFDLDPDCYQGFQFRPIYNGAQDAHSLLGLVFKCPPLTSTNLYNLLTAKTQGIVRSINKLMHARLMFSECYLSDLDLFYSLRSELRNLTQKADMSDGLAKFKTVMIHEMRLILDSLSEDPHFWVHFDDDEESSDESDDPDFYVSK